MQLLLFLSTIISNNTIWELSFVRAALFAPLNFSAPIFFPFPLLPPPPYAENDETWLR